MKRVCIVGCGAIGSLYAAHLARVAEVWAFVRREDHARALNHDGLSVSGKHEFHVSLQATTRPDQLPDCDLGIKVFDEDGTKLAGSVTACEDCRQGGFQVHEAGLGSG